MVTTGSV